MRDNLTYVEDARATKAIALSPDFKTYSMADRYRELAKTANVDFSASIHLLEHLPVFMDGERHHSVRKLMAKQISKTQEQQRNASEGELQRLGAAHLQPGSELDIVSDFCRPLWRAISTVIVPRSQDTVDLVEVIPALFSPILSIRERLKIEARVAGFLRDHCSQSNDALVLLCLATLGTRPFAGSLALSLWSVLRSNPGLRTSEFEWPALYPASSLTYFDRIYAPTGEGCRWSYAAGERVRCFTHSNNYSMDEKRSALFGFGAHTCLGKSISEKVWTSVVDLFRNKNLIAECKTLTMSPHNDPFQMPAEIRVALT